MAQKLVPDKPELLSKTDMFSSLLKHELEIIASHSDFKTYMKGASIFQAGDEGNKLYIVRSGEVLVTKQEPYGPVIDIARFIAGNSFGEMDLFTECCRTVSAHASKNSEILVFPKEGISFTEILKNHPEISARILHKLLAVISNRIRTANTMVKENSPIIKELKKQVYRDKLTGIYNDTFLMEKIRKRIAMGSAFALIISKPDNFKELNDEYGHEAGDSVIKLMARKLREHIGDDQRTIRYKGNAMAVILPETDKDTARKTAEGIQSVFKKLDLGEISRGKKFNLSVSAGIALYPDHYITAEELVANTHELPLRARKRGGNLILFPEDRTGSE